MEASQMLKYHYKKDRISFTKANLTTEGELIVAPKGAGSYSGVLDRLVQATDNSLSDSLIESMANRASEEELGILTLSCL